MPKYRLMASFGFVGTDTDYGVEEFDDEDQATCAAHEAAMEQVEAWVELVENDDE